MKNFTKFLLVVAMLFLLSPQKSFAQYTDDFESYAAGEFLHDLDGWHGWDDTAGAGSPVSAGGSSRITWALVPPIPKELTPALRG